MLGYVTLGSIPGRF